MTYPEHERLAVIKDQSQTIGEFLDWLQAIGIVRAVWGPDESLYHDHHNIRDLLAEYFEIDQDRLEDEKRAMLDTMKSDD